MASLLPLLVDFYLTRYSRVPWRPATNSQGFHGKTRQTNRCPGDASGDGYVNVWDRGAMSDAWLTESGDPDYNPNVDFTCDGMINFWDLGILSDYWLQEA